jgi:hypothetical protein
MSWGDYLWGGCKYVYNSVSDGLASGLEWCGNVSSIAGGVLTAASFAVDESISVGYYLAGSISGTVNFNLTVINFAFSIIETFSFSRPANSQGSFHDNLSDTLDPETLRLYALTAIMLGIALKSLGSSLSLYLRSSRERERFKQKKGIDLAMPGWNEYGFEIGKSVSGALTAGLNTHAIALTALKYSGIVTTKRQYTKPATSNMSVCVPDYCGPVEEGSYDFVQNISKMVNVTFGGVTELVDVDAVINGTASGDYGAGATFESKNGVDGTSIIPTAIGAMGTGKLYQFFKQKSEDAHGDRVFNAGRYHGSHLSSIDVENTDLNEENRSLLNKPSSQV